MTGRRLYDHFTDALASRLKTSDSWHIKEDGTWGQMIAKPFAWPLLTAYEQRLWNELARRTTTKKSVKR